MAHREPAAWETFLDTYGDLLYSHIHHVVQRNGKGGSKEEVEDMVQSFFLGLLEKNGRRLLLYEDRGSAGLASWLRAVATNHVYGVLRRRKPLVNLRDLPEAGLDRILQETRSDASESPRDRAAAKERLQELEEAVSGLSTREQLVFQYYYLDERPRDHVAAALGLEPNNVDQILHRLRGKLAQRLKSQHPM